MCFAFGEYDIGFGVNGSDGQSETPPAERIMPSTGSYRYMTSPRPPPSRLARSRSHAPLILRRARPHSSQARAGGKLEDETHPLAVKVVIGMKTPEQSSDGSRSITPSVVPKILYGPVSRLGSFEPGDKTGLRL